MSTASLRKWWHGFVERHVVMTDPRDRPPEAIPKARDIMARPMSRPRIRRWVFPQTVNGRYLGSTVGIRVYAHSPAAAARQIAQARGLTPSVEG